MEIVILYHLSRRLFQSVFHFIYQVTRRKGLSAYIFALLFLPGTFIHEMSHFLAALFLLVPTGELRLIPKFNEKGHIDLGSVLIAKTDPVRRFLIGISPFIFGSVIIITVLYFVSMNRFIDTWWGNILAGLIIFEVGNSMFASKKDLEGTVILFIFTLFVIAFLYLLDIRIPISLSDLSFNQSTLEIFKNANIFLLVPIVIDAGVLLLFKKL